MRRISAFDLMRKIFALVSSVNAYSEIIAIIVLSALAFALILVAACVHRIANRILSLTKIA